MIVEILGRYQRLGIHERHALVLAFDYTKDKLELEYGDFAGWRAEHKTDVADKLMLAGRAWRVLHIGETDCVAGVIGLELRNPLGSKSARFAGGSSGDVAETAQQRLFAFELPG
jgi:hypothetical protein